MMNRGRVLLSVSVKVALTCACGLSFYESQPAWGVDYIVQPRDTLSKLAARKLGRPVYGDHGTLAQLARANQQVKNLNRVRVGQRLTIPQHEDPQPEAANDQFHLSQWRQPAATHDLNSAETSPHVSRYSVFRIDPMLSFTRIDSRDNAGQKAMLGSSLNYGASLSWFQVWSETLSTFARASTLQISLEPSGQRIVLASKQFYSTLSLGAVRRFGAKTSANLAVSVSEEIFHHSVDALTVKMDRVLTSRVDLGLVQDLIRAEPFALGLSLDVGLLGPSTASTYATRAGYTYRVALQLKQADPKSRDFERLGLKLFYAQTQQDSTILTQRRRDLGIEASYGWSFGK